MNKISSIDYGYDELGEDNVFEEDYKKLEAKTTMEMLRHIIQHCEYRNPNNCTDCIFSEKMDAGYWYEYRCRLIVNNRNPSCGVVWGNEMLKSYKE